MPGLQVNVYRLVSRIPDESFDRIKTKFSEKKDSFVNPKDHPMAGPLLAVLLDDRLLPLLDRELFSRSIQAVVPKDIIELKWLAKYTDLLVRTLGDVQKNTAKDERASKYANHLINKLIPDFKKKLQSSAKAEKLPEELAFIYKVTACLLRCVAHNKYPFELEVDREIMSELEKRIVKLPGNIFSAYSNEERAYAMFLSWVLQEILCEQDGIEEV